MQKSKTDIPTDIIRRNKKSLSEIGLDHCHNTYELTFDFPSFHMYHIAHAVLVN